MQKIIIKTQRGSIQIPSLVAIIVCVVGILVGVLGVGEYYNISKLIERAEQLTNEEKYNEAIEMLELAQMSWLVKNLGIREQEIANIIEKNETLFEDKSEYNQGIEEFNRGNWEKAEALLLKVSEISPYYQEARSKILRILEAGLEKERRIAEERQRILEARLEKERRIAEERQRELEARLEEVEKRWVETETKRKIENLLRIGHLLQDYYNIIREKEGPDQSWWLWFLFGDRYLPQQDIEFAADLAKHGARLLYWPGHEIRYYERAGTHSYDDAVAILDNVLFSDYAVGINHFDSDYEKIRKILDFLNFHIDYEHDFNHMLRAPAETLGLRSGDCDDWSILVSAAFARVGINSAIMFVESKDGTRAHAMVLFQSEEHFPGLWYYPDLTHHGLPNGEWYIIEPQYTLETNIIRDPMEGFEGWEEGWRLIAVALVSG